MSSDLSYSNLPVFVVNPSNKENVREPCPKRSQRQSADNGSASGSLNLPPAAMRSRSQSRIAPFHRFAGETRLSGEVEQPYGALTALVHLSALKASDVARLERLATHAATPPALLAQLATHHHPAVRAALGDNKNTPLPVLRELASDADPDVRYQLAENHNLPLAVLQLLENDGNPYVAHRAQRTVTRLAKS